MAEAAQALAGAQKRGLEALIKAADEDDDAPEPPHDEIEPEITASAPLPLFSTEDDFVAASTKLIDRKRLADDEDESGEDAS